MRWEVNIGDNDRMVLYARDLVELQEKVEKRGFGVEMINRIIKMRDNAVSVRYDRTQKANNCT